MKTRSIAVCTTSFALALGTTAYADSLPPEQSPSNQHFQQPEPTETFGQQEQGSVDRAVGQDDVSLASLSIQQKKDLQQRLREEGYYQGNIDGIIGPQTRAALRSFQSEEGLGQGGELSSATANRLGIDLDETEPVRGIDDSSTTGRSAQGGAQQGATQQGAGAGQSGAADPGYSEPAPVELSALDAEQAESLQTSLQQAGYYKGEIDGRIGPMTREALRRYFQERAQLAAQGRLNIEDAEQMGISVDDIQPVRGIDEPGQGRQPSQGSNQQQGTEQQPQQGQPQQGQQGQPQQPMRHPVE